jgi:hypothetical protein
VLITQRHFVPHSHAIQFAQGGKDPPIILGTVPDQEVDVLGRPHETVRDYGETADDHEPCTGGDERRRGLLELRLRGPPPRSTARRRPIAWADRFWPPRSSWWRLALAALTDPKSEQPG